MTASFAGRPDTRCDTLETGKCGSSQELPENIICSRSDADQLLRTVKESTCRDPVP